MKCGNCGSEWNVPAALVNKIDKCPFCQASLKPANSSIRDTLKWIVQDRGIEVFQNETMLNALLADLIAEDEAGRKKIKMALSAGAGNAFYRVVKSREPYDMINHNQMVHMLSDCGFQPYYYGFVLDCFEYAIGYFSVETEPEEEETVSVGDLSGQSDVSEQGTETAEENEKSKDSGTELTPEEKAKKYYSYAVSFEQNGDYLNAFRCYSVSAENGNTDAQLALANAYACGRGVEENLKEAFSWYSTAAENGNVMAKYAIGHAYEFGRGVELNKKFAFDWYFVAAKRGDVNAMYKVAMYYYVGDVIAKNLEQAYRWFWEAANRDDSRAQNMLGIMNEYGIYVQKNDPEAIRWYEKAKNKNNTDAIKNYNRLLQQMNPMR